LAWLADIYAIADGLLT